MSAPRSTRRKRKNRGGRPKLPPGVANTRRVTLRLYEADERALETITSARRIDASEAVRLALRAFAAAHNTAADRPLADR